jgi:hypothetical protein
VWRVRVLDCTGDVNTFHYLTFRVSPTPLSPAFQMDRVLQISELVQAVVHQVSSDGLLSGLVALTRNDTKSKRSSARATREVTRAALTMSAFCGTR